jgi:protein O-GlcNAc transferase
MHATLCEGNFRMISLEERDDGVAGPQGANLQSVLRQAAGDHAAGRLAEAERGYRQVLKIDPRQADVLHLLGALSGQLEKYDAGIELISRAIEIRRNTPSYHASLAKLLKARGRLDEAITAYRQALALDPAMADVQNNLGVALRVAGKLEEANAAFGEAIRLNPNLAEAWNNFGYGLVTMQRFDEAAEACRKAIALKPTYSEAFHNLGMALAERGAWKEAAQAYQRAIQIAPNYADAHNNLGNVLRAMGSIELAIDEYKIAVQLKPIYVEAFNNLGLALGEAGRGEEAIGPLAQAIELKPDFAEAFNSLGNVLQNKGDLDGASAAYERALELKPDYAEAMCNLAVVRKDQGLHKEAAEYATRSIQVRPDHAAHGNLIYLLHFHPRCRGQVIVQEQAKWERIHAEPVRREIRPHEIDRREKDRAGGRKPRIGYIGPYFRNHVVGRNILPLLREHDHGQFEIVCYSDVVREDAITEQCRAGADQWRKIVGMSDQEVANLIRADGIDILVDLALHLSGNRLLVLARKPAPVQVTFAGYPAGTGLKAIDYRITDPYLDPPGEDESDHVEKSIRLPHSFWCYDEAAMTIGLQHVPEVASLPVLDMGQVTFGCLNNFCKVNGAVLDLWARVLNAVSGSRLVMLAPAGSAQMRVVVQMAELGIGEDRLEFVTHQSRERYLEQYNGIDIGLDTFPYNGHTTSLDSLWMGVPVVTMRGSSAVGRAGVSQLTNLGLTELVAENSEEYVRIAADLAGDLHRLRLLRAKLREMMRGSPLMDAKRFARDIESTYQTMWASTTRL